MKLTLWLSALSLALGASASSAVAGERGVPTSDPNQRPATTCGIMESVYGDGCSLDQITPVPPVRPVSPGGRTTTTTTGHNTITVPSSGRPECGWYQIPLTAQELFPEWVMLLDRMRGDEQKWQADLATTIQQRQLAANDVYRLFDYANDPRYRAQYNHAVFWRDSLAERETFIRRKLTELATFRQQKEAFMAKVGTQTVRLDGCIDRRVAINYVRGVFRAPPI